MRLPKDPRFRITQAKPPDGGRKRYREGAAEQPGSADLLIAATALEHGLTLPWQGEG